MAGKSNKAKKKASQTAANNASEHLVTSEVTVNDNNSTIANSASEHPATSEVTVNDNSTTIANSVSEHPVTSEVMGNDNSATIALVNTNESKLEDAKSEQMDSGDLSPRSQAKQGDIHLYPVTIRTQSGDKLELQLSPGDSVMDVRQFLLEAPKTCFFTCYDLSLHTKDGSIHHLEDFNEISEVADITTGGCHMEMVAASYDDRSIRAHVNRTRDLLSLSTLHFSLSTSLALQHEIVQSTPTNADSSKTEVPELDNLVFTENASGLLTNLLSAPSKEIKCVESVIFSSFNPPPSYRRLSGDLIYLDVVTLEGNRYCVTGTTKTFYVNSSSANALDPRPSKSVAEATTLVGLLQKISSKFKKGFREILEQKAAAHPFENVPSMLSPNSWLELYPIPDHRRDAARAEDALTLTFGSELIGMQRDWNEELQSCREFPHTSPQERILRDRALYKVTSDFVDAATKGAIGVISRCIPPINPTDPECFHMYVHNNIFFSFAVDTDLEQLSRKQSSDVHNKSEIVGLLHASSEKTTTISEQVPSGVSNGCNQGKIDDGMVQTPSVPEEVQLAESEQATYASANNDLKGTKAYHEVDIPGLYNLAMAIIDYRGHRIVAQSVLPGILQGDKSDSLLYGSVDNGKKICWSEEFHSKVAAAAKSLHMKEHAVSDGSGNEYKLAAPVECKGIVGSDDRHYLLDLMRVTPRDANYTGPGSRFCILRPELITAYCHKAETAEMSKNQSKGVVEAGAACDTLVDEEDEVEPNDTDKSETASSQMQDLKDENLTILESAPEAETKDLCEDILFNPNVFTEFTLAGSPEEIAADEENVRKASSYLNDIVLPKFIQDLCALEVSPIDGQTLTEALHAHGINIRYIGKVAEDTRHLPHLWDLLSNEIVVRSAKHVLKEVLRDTEDQAVGHAISHVFNCLFGNVPSSAGRSVANSSQSSSQKQDPGHQGSGKTSKGRSKYKASRSTSKKQSLFSKIHSDSLWSDIKEFSKIKYQFELPEDSRMRVKKIPVIRNLCQKVGVSIAARKYDLDSIAPFQISDILDLKPLVKHAIPVSSEAKKLVETGKVRLAEGLLAEAYTLFSEAFAIFQQVTGPVNREVANCCRYLAMVLYHARDLAAAIVQQHKELIINERCLGLDHPDTAHSYGNMALFYHGLNQTDLALQHMSRALLLLSLSCGSDHPDVAATFINVAMMYQDSGNMNIALRYLQEALKKNERLLGEEHIQTAVCYHALAIAFNCMGAFKLSHQHEKKTYDILVKQLGEKDSRTCESQTWMKEFKKRELQMNAQKQKGQALDAASAQKAIEMIKAHPDLMQAFQVAAASGSSVGPTNAANKSLNTALMGEVLPRGRGVDERAARAAAEVRKKAAAKGLLVRPHGHGVPVQALPPITQLLDMMNPGAASEAKNEDKTIGDEKSNGHLENGSDQQNQAPAGLGSGLADLDRKKQKSKAKA